MLRPEIMQPEIEDLQQLDPSRSLLAGPPHDKTAELLLTEAPRYKNVLETNTAKVKDRYDSYMAPIKYADTVAKFKHKYAVGRAFQVLGVTQPADIRYSLKYNEVQRIAAEVEKDPEFQKNIDRLIQATPKEQIEGELNEPRPSALDPMPGYSRIEKISAFEDKFTTRMCEEFIKAQNPAACKDGKRPQVSKEMFDLYKKRSPVGSYVDKITAGKDEQQIEALEKDLDDPNKLRSMIINYTKHAVKPKEEPLKKNGPVANQNSAQIGPA